MKKILFSLLALMIFTGAFYAQEETDIVKKEKKMIIIKTIDDEGNVMTEVIEGDDVKDFDGNINVTEDGDSIRVEIELDEGDGKRIKKRIVIPDMEDFEIEGLEDLEKDIHIYKFDDEFGPGCPHMLWMDKFRGPHFMERDHMMYFDEGSPSKPKLGVMIEDVSNGVKVNEVIENSSAWSVGILAGDVITEIDGKKMTNVEEVIRAVSEREVGDIINIKLKRNGKTKKFSARLQGDRQHFEFKMPPGFKDGMKKMKHHLYRSIDEFQDQQERKKDIIIDKELKLKEKHKQLEHKMKKMEEKKERQYEMQQKEKEILEREIEKNKDDSN
jgi:membrane-associated protease RseP (regulator of RpoE activity)